MSTTYINCTPRTAIEINDAILKAIQRNYNTFVKLIHDEAKGYCFQGHDNVWHVARYDFINEVAGLGSVNHCLLTN